MQGSVLGLSGKDVWLPASDGLTAKEGESAIEVNVAMLYRLIHMEEGLDMQIADCTLLW